MLGKDGCLNSLWECFLYFRGYWFKCMIVYSTRNFEVLRVQVCAG